MSQRFAMIMALVLTLVLGTGVYAARGRVTGTDSVQTTDQTVVATDVVIVPEEVMNRQNPPAKVATEVAPGTASDSSYSESSEHDEDEDDEDDVYEKATKSSGTSERGSTTRAEHEENEDD